MATRPLNNLLALAVLAYLSRGPMHPYELGTTLRAHADDRSIKFTRGSLYMVVKQLDRAGLIEPQGTSRAGRRPERTTYAITSEGRAELHDWLCELVAEPRHEYPQFIAALALIAALSPDEVVELLRERRQRLVAELAAIRDLVASTGEQGVHPLFLIEEDYRIALLDAEIAFVDRFVGQIEDPGTGWRALWLAAHAEFADDDQEVTGGTSP
jgi:DNA-binding PadR family transcriptional regulator